MHGCVMENVQKIKIKLKNIWIDLIRSIYALYSVVCDPTTCDDDAGIIGICSLASTDVLASLRKKPP